MTDEDFREIAKEWTHDGAGREQPHVGAIHRDSGGQGHDHMHLMIARDKFSKEELTERKEISEDLIRDIERAKGIERETEHDRELQRSAQGELDEYRDRGEERDRHPKEQEHDRGREIER